MLKKAVVTGLASLTLLDISAAIAGNVSPSYNWTGFYAGAHAGYRWADASISSDPYVFIFDGPNTISDLAHSFKLNGGIFGIHGGYNYQFQQNWLVGIEGDIFWGARSGSTSVTIISQDGQSSLLRNTSVEIKNQSSVRGRLGWVSGPWLFYGTGGVAFTHVNLNDHWQGINSFKGLVFDLSNGKNLTGWTVGTGAEYMLSANWLVRLEYLYADFGHFNLPLTGPVAEFGRVDLHTNIVRAGISYKFGPISLPGKN